MYDDLPFDHNNCLNVPNHYVLLCSIIGRCGQVRLSTHHAYSAHLTQLLKNHQNKQNKFLMHFIYKSQTFQKSHDKSGQTTKLTVPHDSTITKYNWFMPRYYTHVNGSLYHLCCPFHWHSVFKAHCLFSLSTCSLSL